MRKGGGSGKGASFEREISKMLSLWWTQDSHTPPRDDIFWRSSQSGGRATQRAKSGKQTAGSYGDLAALDPIGAPLLDAFCFELKRGYKLDALDLIDRRNTNKMGVLADFMRQAKASAEQSDAYWPFVIFRRDKKCTCAFFPYDFLLRAAGILGPSRHPKLIVPIDGMRYVIMALDDFLSYVSSYAIQQILASRT